MMASLDLNELNTSSKRVALVALSKKKKGGVCVCLIKCFLTSGLAINTVRFQTFLFCKTEQNMHLLTSVLSYCFVNSALLTKQDILGNSSLSTYQYCEYILDTKKYYIYNSSL